MSKKWIAALGILAAAGLLANRLLEPFRLEIPDPPRPAKTLTIPQNWTPAQQSAFHHLAQGTRLVPWSWFKALEQPCLSLWACPDLSDPAYLYRFGFIPSANNPDALPIGFARQDNFHDPVTKQTYPVVGFTCAACHTGELFYNGTAIRIEGAPAMVDLGAFQKALGLALALNDRIPARYTRFEQRILGANPTNDQRYQLRRDVDAFLAQAMKEREYTQAHHIYDDQAGFGRTDALARIGNQVFAVDLDHFENFSPANAPVRFPQIWDAPWFDWIQYNSSIADPLVRNIGEALGVRAMLTADLDNSVEIGALHQLETLIAGPAPFQGLQSPKWPAFFPPIDPNQRTKGAALYKKHCESCHLPTTDVLLADRQSKEPRYWEAASTGVSFLKVTDINIQTIGTDPAAALDFRNRTANSGALKQGRLTAAEGLDFVTRALANRFFDLNKFSPEQRLVWSGNRTPGADPVRDKLVYKARTLNGIWAVAPYLHNGSVPTLYHLLSPRAERPARFWAGNKEFDPIPVGYRHEWYKNGYLYDTALPGNSNAGHEFADAPAGNGIIGPYLPPDDRWALIAYLKSL